MTKKWLHIIGVCGKTTANIAKEFQDMGWFVTGSDNQYLPPASNILIENKINTVEGFDFRHLTKEFWTEKLRVTGDELRVSENPDLVLFISHLTTKNKEYLYARKKNLDIRPYSRILKEYLIKDQSVVVIGTAGKTTTTALTTFLFQKLGLNPSYMVGADVVDIEDSLKITNSEFSVIEGDEYHNPDKEIEGEAKFLEYKPKYLIITKISWEHFDIFPTEELYIQEFRKAVELVPEDGLIIAKEGDENIDKVLESGKAKVIRYSYQSSVVSNQFSESRNTQPATNELWTVSSVGDENVIYDPSGSEILRFKTDLLGTYNLENILATVILICNIPAHSLPADLVEKGTQNLKDIAGYISEFHGVKKRLEHIYKSENLTIIDDFGIAPDRAKNSLETINQKYPEHKIISIFEPNAGSRPKDIESFNKAYQDSLQISDMVIIPDLSEVNDDLASTSDVVERFENLKINAVHISNNEISKFLLEEMKKSNEKLIIVFFSSYKLTNVEEELVRSLK